MGKHDKHEHTPGAAEVRGHDAQDVGKVRCAVLTVSDTRTIETDEAGPAITEMLQALGHRVVERAIVKDDVEAIRGAVLETIEKGWIDVLLITGGTGVAPRDLTPEAIEPLFGKSLPGFGELFRQLSFAEIGPKAMVSRAMAGIIAHTAVFALPGSPSACKMAIDRLIGPSLPHMVGLINPRRPA